MWHMSLPYLEARAENQPSVEAAPYRREVGESSRQLVLTPERGMKRHLTQRARPTQCRGQCARETLPRRSSPSCGRAPYKKRASLRTREAKR
jgi:hypothetical protein